MEKQENAELATGALSHLSVELDTRQKDRLGIVRGLARENDALDLMCDFVHDTLQREKREYAACEEYTRRKEEGI